MCLANYKPSNNESDELCSHRRDMLNRRKDATILLVAFEKGFVKDQTFLRSHPDHPRQLERPL